jgi:hypothetical protein
MVRDEIERIELEGKIEEYMPTPQPGVHARDDGNTVSQATAGSVPSNTDDTAAETAEQ